MMMLMMMMSLVGIMKLLFEKMRKSSSIYKHRTKKVVNSRQLKTDGRQQTDQAPSNLLQKQSN